MSASRSGISTSQFRPVDLRGSRLVACAALLSLTMLMCSFRAPNAKQVMLSYSVKAPIAILQAYSLYVVGIAMAACILIIPWKDRALRRPRISTPVLFFFGYQLIAAATTYWYERDLKALTMSVGALVLTVVFFGVALKRFTLGVSSSTSLFKYLQIGLVSFVFLNYVVEFGGLGNTVWKGRMQGVTAHPNFLGAACGLASVCSFVSLVASRKIPGRLINLLSLLASLFLVVLSF